MYDTVMSSSGALKVLGGREPDWKLCNAPYVLVEQDAFLAARNWSRLGHAILKRWILRSQLADVFDDLTLLGPASERLNAIWYSDDVALVYYGWIHSIMIDTMRCSDTIQFYGRTDSALDFVRERLAPFATCHRTLKPR
jgi:hypothetical protein